MAPLPPITETAPGGVTQQRKPRIAAPVQQQPAPQLAQPAQPQVQRPQIAPVQQPPPAPVAPPPPTSSTAAPMVAPGAPVPLSGLGGVLEQQLGNPSRYNQGVVQQSFDWGKRQLEDQAKLGESSAITDASKRGVYYGTPLTTSLGDVKTQFNRGLGDLMTNILREQAQTYGGDLQNAIGNAFRFGENQLQADQFRANLGLGALNQGYAGMPSIQGTVDAMSGLPISQPGGLDLSGLAGLVGGGGPTSAPSSTQSAIAPPPAASAARPIGKPNRFPDLRYGGAQQ